MLDPIAKHNRRMAWALTGLEAGAVLFVVGLLVLYFNPFWHFDEGGFLDWSVHWWNASGEVLVAAGLFTEALAALGTGAALVSRLFGRRGWPYVVAALVPFCAVIWISPAGFTRNLDAHFEWSLAEGFTGFRVQPWNDASGVGRSAGYSVWESIVAIQIQPLLRNYFKLNDWQKMNGDVGVTVVRIIPAAWPIALGSGGETLEYPDDTPLMRAAAREDFQLVQQLLSGATRADVNALDQGGQTALILACQNPNANAEVVKALLAAGADVNLRARNGYTALTWSLAKNNPEVTRLLRRAGGKP